MEGVVERIILVVEEEQVMQVVKAEDIHRLVKMRLLVVVEQVARLLLVQVYQI